MIGTSEDGFGKAMPKLLDEAQRLGDLICKLFEQETQTNRSPIVNDKSQKKVMPKLLEEAQRLGSLIYKLFEQEAQTNRSPTVNDKSQKCLEEGNFFFKSTNLKKNNFFYKHSSYV